MGGGWHDAAARERALASAPALLRLAHQLTGNPEVAGQVVVRALAALSPQHRHGEDPGFDEALTRAVLRALPRRPPPVTTASALDALPPRARTATVLAFAAGWDAEGVGDATRMSPGRTRTLVAQALAIAPQEQWERLLAAPRWSLLVPADLAAAAERAVRHRREERRLRALAAACLATALAAGSVAAVRLANEPVRIPGPAHESGLLHWPVRGDLARDGQLIAEATRLWRRAPDGPAHGVYPLWAGRVGVGRLVVLQARDARGVPRMAVVADHDVTFGHARLRLDEAELLPTVPPPVLVVPYDGNLNVAGLQSGPSQQVLQLLARPDVDRVDERSNTAATTVPMLRPSYRSRVLTDGMSDPWLDVRGDQVTTAVRAWSNGSVVFTGLVSQGSALDPVDPVLSPPPSRWAGLPRGLGPDVVADDAVWWAQVCHDPRPSVSDVWADPTAPDRLRMELVGCPGRPWAAQVLTDGSSGSEWALRRDVTGAAAVIGRLPRTGLLVVVGDRDVAAVAVGGSRFVGRVFVGPWPSTTGVHVLDAHGHRLPL